MKSQILSTISIIMCLSINAMAGIVETEAACQRGDLKECANFAVAQAVAGNLEEAKKYAKKSCDGEVLHGCMILGVLITEKEPSDAKKLLKRACDGGLVRGCYNLGRLEYNKGNKDEAKKLFKRSCDVNDSDACYRYGFIEKENGNKPEARRLFKQACEAGSTIGCFELGAIEHSLGNKDEAELLWIKACDDGERSACESLKIVLNEKYRLYVGPCDSGDMGACYNLGLTREKMKHDNTAVFQVYGKACNGGQSDACAAIQRILSRTCIDNNLKMDKECYEDGPIKRISEGSSYVPRVRVHNPSCDEKQKRAELGLGCAAVGDFVAKRAKYDEAEKIFKDGCTDSNNNQGCGGVVCMAYGRLAKGKAAEAKALFKLSCDHAKAEDDTYNSAAHEGCMALSMAPKRTPAAGIENFEGCKQEWQKSW